jgi:hypothetical protein
MILAVKPRGIGEHAIIINLCDMKRNNVNVELAVKCVG